jgi:hypothetical protein
MTNRIEAIPAFTTRGRVANHKSCGVTIIQARKPLQFVALTGILLLVVVCSVLCLHAAKVQAQDLFSLDLAPVLTKTTSAVLPPDTAKSATAPYLLSMAELNRFSLSNSLQTSTDLARPVEANSYMNLRTFSLLSDPRGASFSSINHDSQHPDSFFSFAESKYARWESSLASSRSLTSVNGVPVYPLVQINYAGWHLPIILGNDTSR